MKKISLILSLIIGLGTQILQAQINNAKTTMIAINGNCGMCKKTIDNQGSIENIAQVNWDKETKEAEITYDSTKTSEDEILKKIAQAGYDNAKFRAADEAYDNLHECCKYERDHEMPKSDHHAGHNNNTEMGITEEHNDQATNQKNGLASVFQSYLLLKDALVTSDSKKANVAATQLITSIQKVNMSALKDTEHKTWMKVKSTLDKNAKLISKDTKLDGQRNTFLNISQPMYDLAKVMDSKIDLYWQFCPMANNNKGAYWISKENTIKNPYFGSKMMTCGEVKEKI